MSKPLKDRGPWRTLKEENTVSTWIFLRGVITEGADVERKMLLFIAKAKTKSRKNVYGPLWQPSQNLSCLHILRSFYWLPNRIVVFQK